MSGSLKHILHRPLAALQSRWGGAGVIFQVLLILGFWQAGNLIVHWTALPIPGSVIGLAVVVCLLLTQKLTPGHLHLGARWFLSEMLLFLLPSTVSLLAHPEFFGRTGLIIFSVILFGTVVVMAITALAVEYCCHWLETKPAKPGIQPENQPKQEHYA